VVVLEEAVVSPVIDIDAHGYDYHALVFKPCCIWIREGVPERKADTRSPRNSTRRLARETG